MNDAQTAKNILKELDYCNEIGTDMIGVIVDALKTARLEGYAKAVEDAEKIALDAVERHLIPHYAESIATEIAKLKTVNQ